MNTLSGKTIGRLIQIAREVSKNNLQDLLLDSEVCSEAPDLRPTRHAILTKTLFAAQKRANHGDNEAHKALLAFTAGLVRYCWEHELWQDLKESLRSDGYELMMQPGEDLGYVGEIRPYDSAVAPLHEEMTVLQEELRRRGYDVAEAHYTQAIRHLADQVPTSANAELRSAFESLLVCLAADHTDYQPTAHAGQGGRALQTLWIDEKNPQPDVTLGNPLPAGDGGRMLAGIWNILHTGGSHPGFSNALEARIRMQLVTGLALFLLTHFPHH
ncbi:hypothetical protein [Streptomyces sp. H27-D2]|uniref:hypothetical protein n=1 Tax=Streptomyces sp. H27-D2 TaxID=3046304 RepID=UPI002DBAED30|nr:hypothetical protein [Streptomyces sp. H27-D2]MEC4015850.1 hypothetical protein [Streptomyces sp. H27-D2]